ncbi:MAG TPA: inorganic phosphate transporter [Nevskia sp.]|nr:inorganic phosphate transporter [Nevskia sp.]
MLAELGIDTSTFMLLGLALLMALSFEFVNGFHDTANAVATVIYTHTLKPTQAVVWSGAWNLIGVLTSTGAVAFGILALLPVELVLNVGSGAGFAMVFALLTSAIIWNVGTWYLGLPASSSHTLIGSIVGVGLMNSYLSPGSAFGDGVNWTKVADTGKALLFSPIIGFVFAALVLLLMKALIRMPALFESPKGDTPPPWPVRLLLVLTCTGVSFAHGSNDGQKGMGLIMLILIGIAPVGFALNLGADADKLARIQASATTLQAQLAPDGAAAVDEPTARTALTQFLKTKKADDQTVPALAQANRSVIAGLQGVKSLNDVQADKRRDLRMDLYMVTETLNNLAKAGKLPAGVDKAAAGKYAGDLKGLTTFIPVWVKVAVAVALGLGTMIGWKRIVVTVGEKIGKAHLTYGQGASAELVAFATIEAADQLGLPVSTTHVLSSGIAGTMVANKSGVQGDTIRNVLLAWVLTLPVCVLLGAMTFAAGLFLVFRVLGMH